MSHPGALILLSLNIQTRKPEIALVLSGMRALTRYAGKSPGDNNPIYIYKISLLTGSCEKFTPPIYWIWLGTRNLALGFYQSLTSVGLKHTPGLTTKDEEEHKQYFSPHSCTLISGFNNTITCPISIDSMIALLPVSQKPVTLPSLNI